MDHHTTTSPEGGAAEPPPSNRITTQCLIRWSPLTCPCFSMHDISWEAEKDRKPRAYHVCLNSHLSRKDWDTNSKPAELALRGNPLLPPGRRAKIGVRLPWAACTPLPQGHADTHNQHLLTHRDKQVSWDEWGSSISRHKERSGGFGTSARMSSRALSTQSAIGRKHPSHHHPGTRLQDTELGT